MTIEAPSGVVTFLFTDIEGSTRRWEADPDSMRSALAAHDELLRSTFDAYDGMLFKHTGDGVCAAFSSPAHAVDAAVAAQRALGLPVRMGIATGEAQFRDGDYFGTVLNRAARVMAAGHGGQILVDGATAGLVSAVSLVSLGRCPLRGLSKSVELFQVRADGLRSEFPRLNTADTRSGNLRLPSTSLVGREAELSELQTAIKEHRLVTLTGVGGVGKTRLALEVAARCSADFPDGIWVVELASVTDSAAVPDAVAAALGITQQAGMTVAESVSSALESRSRLLVLDNCEHVLDAITDLIEAVLAQSGRMRILATSREGTRLPEEQLWPVKALRHTGFDSAAATLFVERARSVASSVTLTDVGQASAVAEICRRLDGIPLAIELAASRLQSMTVDEVRDRLDDCFRLLVGTRRGLARHQTLRAAVQWSYDLLDETEKALLQRCSVFTGGFDLAAACAVGGIADDFAVLDLLDSLVRKSLLVADRSSRHTRYSILETIRRFGEEQLTASGQADATREAHAKHFAGLEDSVLSLWNSPRQREAYDWFNTELPNLRTAFRWAKDHGDLDAAAAIAVYATPIGNWIEQHEPTSWAEELVDLARAAEHPRLAQLYVMAAQCSLTGRIDQAIAYADAGQDAIASGRFDPIPLEFEAFLGDAYPMGGRPQEWAEWCRRIIAEGSGTGTYAKACLVLALMFSGDGDGARAAADGLLEVADSTANPQIACFALFAYGWAHRHSDPALAYGVLRRGLDLALESGNRQFESHFAVNLSGLSVTHGDPMDAFDLLTLAIRMHYDSGSFLFLRTPFASLAAFFVRLGHHESAAIISGFAATPLTVSAFPEMNTAITRLRQILGEQSYTSLAQTGADMTIAEMVGYSLERIAEARAHLAASRADAKEP